MLIMHMTGKRKYPPFHILSDVEELLHKQAAGRLTAKVFTVFTVQTETPDTFWDRL